NDEALEIAHLAVLGIANLVILGDGQLGDGGDGAGPFNRAGDGAPLRNSNHLVVLGESLRTQGQKKYDHCNEHRYTPKSRRRSAMRSCKAGKRTRGNQASYRIASQTIPTERRSLYRAVRR